MERVVAALYKIGVEKVEGLWRGNEKLYAEEFPEREEESDCIEKAGWVPGNPWFSYSGL